jgi:hypothetical protein
MSPARTKASEVELERKALTRSRRALDTESRQGWARREQGDSERRVHVPHQSVRAGTQGRVSTRSDDNPDGDAPSSIIC